MDGFTKLSREAQVVLGGGVLLLILSFLDWQQASFSFANVGGTVGLNEWHGIGVLAGLLVVAMLAWEVVRLLAVNVSLGALSPGLVSVGLALIMVLFTLIAFLNKGTARHWPAWVALLVALLVGVAAVMRGRAEGVQMPQIQQSTPAGSAGPAAPVAPSEPVAPAEPAAEPTADPSE